MASILSRPQCVNYILLFRDHSMRDIVMSTLIRWALAQNNPCCWQIHEYHFRYCSINGGWRIMASILQTKYLKCTSWACILLCLDFNSTEVYSNWQVTIGSGNGLAPNRCQAITWTDNEPVHWHKCVTRPQWVKVAWPTLGQSLNYINM